MMTQELGEQLLTDCIVRCRELLAQQQTEMALILAEQMSKFAPTISEVKALLGLAYHQKKDYPNAIHYLRLAVNECPDNSDYLNNLALPLLAIGESDEAEQLLLKACSLNPQSSSCYSNLGLHYRSKGEYEKSKEILEHALSIQPASEIYMNLGGVLGEMHEIDRSIECFEKAIQLNPANAAAHTDLAYGYHLKGEYSKAWAEYEWRYFFQENLKSYREKYDMKLKWDGSPLTSEDRLMVFFEQGYGDCIQFARYIPEIKKRYGCKVLAHCSPELQTLFEKANLGIDQYFMVSPGIMQFVLSHTKHVLSASLPYVLGLDSIDDICGEFYLKSDEIPYLDSYKEFKKIGICWAGGPLHPNDRIRSCHLKYFQEIHDLPGVKLFSFCDPSLRTYGKGIIDLAEGVEDMRIVDCWDSKRDFQGTANWIKNLDLLITVDTSILHLAGGLGIPTIGLIAYNPDWRWGLDSDKTPWYNSVKLARQSSRGDWESAFQKAKELCHEMLLSDQ